MTSKTTSTSLSTVRTTLATVVALVIGSVFATVWPTTQLDAQQQQQQRSDYEQRRQELLQRHQRIDDGNNPLTFKSGGERSEIILREIADTLKKMDQRIEIIEKTCVKLNGERRLPYNTEHYRK